MRRRYARAVLLGIVGGAVAAVAWAQAFGDDGGGSEQASAERPATTSTPPPSSSSGGERPSTTSTTSTTTTVPASDAEYVFPIDPTDAASYGRSHHDYPATDIFAPCGAGYLAPTNGVVHELSRVDRWNPANDTGATRGGLFVSVVGDDGVRYYGSHLEGVDDGLKVGDRVVAGENLGAIGNTGNAKGTDCHVHFGISPPCAPGDWAVRRGTIYPWPYLDSWRGGGDLSPSSELQVWETENPDACATADRPDT